MKVKVHFQKEYVLAHILSLSVFGVGHGEGKLCKVSFPFSLVITQSSGLEVSPQRVLSNTFVESAIQP